MAADYKVRLNGPGGEVVFEASAPMGESRQAEYDGYNIVHLPTSLISYRKTSSRAWAITGKLVSRNVNEANANASYLNLLRSWILPDFGSTGATPPILTIYAYRNRAINGRKVVLKSYNWNFPEDVDYIFEGVEPMPVIGTIEVQVEEIYSAEEVTNGAWKINTSAGGGSFLTGDGETNSAFTIDVGFGRVDPLRTALPSSSNITPVMSALGSNGNITIPGAIAGSIARTLGNAALNSSAVREVTNSLPPVVRNVLVGGGNIAITEIGKAVTTGVSTATQPTQQPNGFNRTDSLPAPTPVGS